MCLCLQEHMSCVWGAVPREAEEGTGPPEGGVTGSSKTAQSLGLQSPNHFFSVNLQGHQQVAGAVDAGLYPRDTSSSGIAGLCLFSSVLPLLLC